MDAVNAFSTPASYVNSPASEFSSLADIRKALGDVRRQYRAEFAILVVLELPNRWLSGSDMPINTIDTGSFTVKPRKLFRSLLFASHSKRRDERALLSKLQHQGLAVTSIRFPWKDASAKELLNEPLFKHLYEGTLQSVEGVLSAIAIPFTPDPIHPIAIGVIIGKSHPDWAAVGDTLNRRLAKLKALVIRSEAVSVNRSITFGDSIDLVLRRCLDHVKSKALVPFEQSIASEQPDLDRLTELSAAVTSAAALLTGSEVGNLCLAGKDTQNLYLVGHCINLKASGGKSNLLGTPPDSPHSLQILSPLTPVRLRETEAKKRKIRGTTKKSVVEYVYEIGRPLVINSVRDFLEMHQAVQYANVPLSVRKPNANDIRELAVPISVPRALTPSNRDGERAGSEGIASQLDSEEAMVFGVLNLAKRSQNYGPDDLFVARHLAQYFCIQRNQVLADSANTILASRALTDSNSHLEPHELVRQYCTLEHEALDDSLETPIESSLARESIRTALKALYLTTRSCHVTVRIATPDGKALVRFTEWPNGKGLHEFDRISTRNAASVNCWVFRNNSRCYVRNMNSAKKYLEKEYPGLQGVIRAWEAQTDTSTDDPVTSPKSELCYPIVLRGRVVGTLDLESNYYGAYGASVEDSVRVILEEIQLSLSRSQLMFEHELLLTLATTRLSSHEVLGVADDLNDIAKRISNDALSATLLGKANRLSQIVSEVSSIAFTRGASEKLSLNDVIITAQGQKHFFVPLDIRDPERLCDERLLAANLAFHLSLILKPLLRNAAAAARLTPKASVRVIPRLVRRSARVFLSITVSNPIQPRQVPLPRLARALYRIPTATERWHLGAFLAGTLARSLGGDVYAAINPRRRNIQVIVEVPLESSSSPPNLGDVSRPATDDLC